MGDRLFILAGQSNVPAVPGASELPSYLNINDSGIQIWNGSAFNTLQFAVNNNPLGGGATNWGPEAQFSYLFRQEFPSETIYWVKYGVSGTYLYNVSPTANWNANATGGASLLDTLLNNALKAAQTLSNPEITLLWDQGGNDGEVLAYAQAYEPNCFAMTNKVQSVMGYAPMRMVLSNDTAPGMPSNLPYISIVEAAQQAVAASAPGRITWVNTAVMEHYPANPNHLDANGQVACGQAYYAAYRASSCYAAAW